MVTPAAETSTRIRPLPPAARTDTSARAVRVDDNATFTNRNGHSIACKSWGLDEEPRALVFMAHGFGEHCHGPTYDMLARELVTLGFHVFAHDHVGHGKSNGPRATVKSADIYVDDIIAHVDAVSAKFAGKPVYLIGHSMGGLLVVLAVQRRPKDFAGMVLVAPFLGPDKEDGTWFKMALVRILGRLVPCLPLGKESSEMASRDPAVIERLDNDPLNYSGMLCAGWVAAMVQALESALAAANAVKIPILILHGSADRCCDPDASREFFEKISSGDKTIKIYNGAYHCLLDEPDGVGQRVLSDIVNWCSERLPPAPSAASTSLEPPCSRSLEQLSSGKTREAVPWTE